ncbi:MAG: hypothetical protein MdMp024_1939 [Bacteroidales bacterium]
MNGKTQIIKKQQGWAQARGITRVGGTINYSGEKNYTNKLQDNLFKRLSPQSEAEFKKGNGNEIKDSNRKLAKMKALHSSSAIVVNVFQYWRDKEDIYPIVYSCGLCGDNQSRQVINGCISFEKKFKLIRTPPNIDIFLKYNMGNNPKVCAIESKFTEPYTKNKNELHEVYIKETSIWKGLDNLYDFAKRDDFDSKFTYLSASQLIKHILGLSKMYGKEGFCLLYLWYNVDDKEGTGDKHKKEIKKFEDIVKEDNINFRHITYQEVIKTLVGNFYKENEEYCKYISERYL